MFPFMHENKLMLIIPLLQIYYLAKQDNSFEIYMITKSSS